MYLAFLIFSNTRQNLQEGQQQPAPLSQPSKNQQAAASLQHVNMIRQAFNDSVKESLPPKVAKQFSPNDQCAAPGAVEGNWKVINEKIKQECLDEKKDKVKAVEKLKKQVISPPSNKKACVEKLDKGTLMCQIKNIMGNDISKDHFTVVSRGNVVELLNDDKPVMLAIREKFNYKVKEAKDAKKDTFKECPLLTVKFNKYGGVVKQTGALPKPKSDDPCSECLKSLENKAVAIEGQKDPCGGCNDINDLSNIGENAFIIENDHHKSDTKGDKSTNK
ncbi:hypothetical protein DMUE_2989 [Dictyocoela muelleri]|nr:hypothetical protein DMUE_2989 [Dictyocoela muelleri]